MWDNYMTIKGAFLSKDLLEFKPQSNVGNGENPTLDELKGINPDVRAWLTIDGTGIDYPVVQGRDDLEYVNKDIYGEFKLSGSIFLSCLNTMDFTDRYNLVYGHHIEQGLMFSDIDKFLENDFFEKHLTGKLYLPNETYNLEVFACVSTDAYDGDVYDVDSLKMKSMASVADKLRTKEGHFRDAFAGDEKIIALSTCADATTYRRHILFAYMKN